MHTEPYKQRCLGPGGAFKAFGTLDRTCRWGFWSEPWGMEGHCKFKTEGFMWKAGSITLRQRAPVATINSKPKTYTLDSPRIQASCSSWGLGAFGWCGLRQQSSQLSTYDCRRFFGSYTWHPKCKDSMKEPEIYLRKYSSRPPPPNPP